MGAFTKTGVSCEGGGGVGDALTTGKLSQFAATTSAELAGVISNETGSGLLVFNDTPTLIAPVLGTPTSGNLNNCTGGGSRNLSVQISTVNSAAQTAEQVLQTYQVPAATLSATGDRLIIKMWGTTSANANTKYPYIKFGSTILSGGGLSSMNAVAWACEAEVYRTGAATQSGYGYILRGTGFATLSVTPAETLANAINVTACCTQGSATAADVVLHGMTVDLRKAA